MDTIMEISIAQYEPQQQQSCPLRWLALSRKNMQNKLKKTIVEIINGN